MLKLLLFTFFVYGAISQCSNGTYDLAGTCTACEGSCATCNGGTSNDCQSCTLPRKFFTGKCVDCPYNSYLNTTGDCNACHHTCDDCSGPEIDSCASCKNNMALVAGKCVCPSGTFLHSSTYTCLPCYPACGSCTGPLASQCLTCPYGLSLQVSACSCPSANYFNTATLSCEGCNSSCAQCSGPTATQCTSCQEGKYLSSGQCLSCNETCQSCSGPNADDCMKCTSDKVLVNGQCIVKKNIGCHETCQQCQGPAQDECVVCNLGLAFLAGGKSGFCVTSCPQSYYLYNTTSSARCIAQTLLRGALSIAKDTNTYRLTFNADISQFFNDIVNLMTIQIQYQPRQKALGFTQRLTLVSQKVISIFLDFDSHLLPSNYLSITFSTPSNSSNLKFKLLDSYLSIELQESMEYSDSLQQAIGAASSLNSAGNQGNGAFSFSSTFFLKSIHAIRSQIMEKMLSYFIFMNVDFPPNLIQYYQDMLDNDDSFLPDMFSSTTQRVEEEKEEAKTAVSQTSASRRRMLASNDLNRSSRYNGLIQNQMFLANYGSEVTVLFIALCLGVLAEVVVRLLPAKYHSKLPYKIAVYCSRALIYNFILNEFIENYHDMALYSMADVLNIADFRAKDAFYYLAGLIALIAVVVIPFAFFFFMRWLFRKMKEYRAADNKEEHKLHDLSERLEIVDKPYKSGRLVFYMYNLFLMIRSFGFAVVIVFAAEVPSFQVLYSPLVTIPVIAYLIKYKPFTVRMQLILTLIYECLFLFASLFVMILHFYNINNIEEADTRTNLGFVIMACSLVMMGLDFLSMIVEIIEMRKHCKRRKARKISPTAFSAVPLQSPTPSSNPIQLTSPTPELKASNVSSSFNGLKLLIDENNDSHADSSVMNEKSESKSPSLISFTPKKKNSHLKVHPGGVNSQLLSTVLKSRKSAVWPTRDSISINPVSPSASEREPGTFSTRNDQDQKVLISQYESERDEGSSTTKRKRNETEKEKKLFFPVSSESEKDLGSFSMRNKKDKKGLLTPDSDAGESPFSYKADPEKKESPKEDKGDN